MHITGDKIPGLKYPVNANDLASQYYVNKKLEPYSKSTIGPAGTHLIYEAPYTRWSLATVARTLTADRNSGNLWYYKAYNFGGLYHLFGHSGLQSSTDGYVWQRRTLAWNLNNTERDSMHYNDGTYYIKSYYTALQSSTDTIHWTARTMASTTSSWAMDYGNGIWFCFFNA